MQRFFIRNNVSFYYRHCAWRNVAVDVKIHVYHICHKSSNYFSQVSCLSYRRYYAVKNDDLPDDRGSVRKTMKKEDKLILQVFEKNPCLSMRGGQVILPENDLNVSCATIRRRRLLTHEVKFRRTT